MKICEQKLMKITHDLFILIFAFTFLYATTNRSFIRTTLKRDRERLLLVVHVSAHDNTVQQQLSIGLENQYDDLSYLIPERCQGAARVSADDDII